MGHLFSVQCVLYNVFANVDLLGMFTVTDFIKILLKYHSASQVWKICTSEFCRICFEYVVFNILDTEYWCISFDSRWDLSRTGDSWPQDGHKAKFVKLFMYEVSFWAIKQGLHRTNCHRINEIIGAVYYLMLYLVICVDLALNIAENSYFQASIGRHWSLFP